MIEHVLTLKPHINGATPRNRASMERLLYAYGYTEPHYPMPATMDTSLIAASWYPLAFMRAFIFDVDIFI